MNDIYFCSFFMINDKKSCYRFKVQSLKKKSALTFAFSNIYSQNYYYSKSLLRLEMSVMDQCFKLYFCNYQ